jgi:hypothetical protein
MKRSAVSRGTRPLKRRKPLAAHGSIVRVCSTPRSQRAPARKVRARVKGTIVGDLRALANGRPCLIRLIGCNNDMNTTALAHYRLAGTCGAGQKPPDTNAAYGCKYCHDAVDGRINVSESRTDLRLAHLEGVMRTLALLAAEGYELRRLP